MNVIHWYLKLDNIDVKTEAEVKEYLFNNSLQLTLVGLLKYFMPVFRGPNKVIH